MENDGHRVWAMNLTNAAGHLRQDQLVYVPIVGVPEPGTLVQLAALAHVGLLGYLAVGTSRWVRRRRR